MSEPDALALVEDDRLQELPESARTTVVLLALDGPLSPSALARRTGMSYRTVLRRLGQLERSGVVRATVDPADTRRRLYDISDR